MSKPSASTTHSVSRQEKEGAAGPYIFATLLCHTYAECTCLDECSTREGKGSSKGEYEAPAHCTQRLEAASQGSGLPGGGFQQGCKRIQAVTANLCL